jgi:hypothetical protein
MKFKSLYLFLLAIALAGCAGTPTFPRRQIDRPYTLPAGEGTFGGSAGYAFAKSKSGSGGTLVSGNDPKSGYWGLGLSDDWALLLFPGVRFQAWKSEDDILGAELTSGFVYSSSAGWGFTPNLSFYYRHKLNSDLALEVSLAGRELIAPKSYYFNGKEAEVRLGPMFQLDATKALSLSTGLKVERLYEASQQQFNSSSTAPLPTSATQYVVPFEAFFSWSVGKKWDITLEYDWEQLGYAAGYAVHTVAGGFAYYW